MARPRRKNRVVQERATLFLDHAALTATTTIKFFKAARRCVVEAAQYLNVTGLAGDGTNAFAGELKQGSVVVATLFNTDTGDVGGASVAADTFVTGTLGATANLVVEAGEILSFVATEDGTQTLPAGRLQVDIRYL